MDPKISNISTLDETLLFTLSGVDVSIANSIRRIIISDIPSFVIKTLPHSENLVNFTINTSRFNNEIIKQRLSCIPIHINDMEFPYDDYIIEVDVTNNTKDNIYVTTKDFQIKNKITDKFEPQAIVLKMFPPDKISGDFIELVRLRPKISSSSDGERIKFTAGITIATAKENSSFNVASTVCFSNTKDLIKINEVWSQKEKILKQEKEPDIEYLKKDWDLLEAKRIFIPNSFDFKIETIGVLSNINILFYACKIMIRKIENFIESLQKDISLIKASIVTIPNSFDIILNNEDYTLGKVIEFILFTKHFNNENPHSDKTVTFCGFKKDHPHSLFSIIRIAFTVAKTPSEVLTTIINDSNELISLYSKLSSNFAD